jgi:hypothetical protein
MAMKLLLKQALLNFIKMLGLLVILLILLLVFGQEILMEEE